MVVQSHLYWLGLHLILVFSPHRAAAQKEPLSSTYVAVPSQEMAPIASTLPSKESNETHEYETPEESEVATEPENQIQIIEHQPVA